MYHVKRVSGKSRSLKFSNRCCRCTSHCSDSASGGLPGGPRALKLFTTEIRPTGAPFRLRTQVAICPARFPSAEQRRRSGRIRRASDGVSGRRKGTSSGTGTPLRALFDVYCALPVSDHSCIQRTRRMSCLVPRRVGVSLLGYGARLKRKNQF